MTDKSPRDPAWRMRIAASMKGNNNAAKSRFSEDLEKQYANDPETLKWVLENQKKLDSPSNDGAILYSDDQIRNGDGKFSYVE